MRRRFTEEQIIGMLKESEAGASTSDLCRQHGISHLPQSLSLEPENARRRAK